MLTTLRSLIRVYSTRYSKVDAKVDYQISQPHDSFFDDLTDRATSYKGKMNRPRAYIDIRSPALRVYMSM